MKVIAFAAQKGGTGKSTSLHLVARTLAAHYLEQADSSSDEEVSPEITSETSDTTETTSLTEFESVQKPIERKEKNKNKILVIDLDNIASSSDVLKPIDLASQDPLHNKHIGAALSDEDENFQNYIVHSIFQGIDYIPSHDVLRKHNFTQNEIKNKIEFSNLKERYEYILIDTPATYNPLHISAFTASDIIVTPVNLSLFDFQPLLQMKTWLRKDVGNVTWKLFINKLQNYRSAHTVEMLEYFYRGLGKELFMDTCIPQSCKVKECIDFRNSLSDSLSFQKYKEAFCKLTSEIVGEQICPQGRI